MLEENFYICVTLLHTIKDRPQQNVWAQDSGNDSSLTESKILATEKD